MGLSKYGIQRANLPLLATLSGMEKPICDGELSIICHPCHWYEKSIDRRRIKEFVKLGGNGGNAPVQGVQRTNNNGLPVRALIQV